MTPDDLSRLSLPSDPRSAIDGRTAFVVSIPDLEKDRNFHRIWMSDSDGVRPFTEGPVDLAPRWSPDGKHLAFLRKRDEKDKPQVAVMPTDGGEPRVITDFTFGVELSLEWSPNGSRLVVVAVTPTEEWEGLDEEDRKSKPRRIDFVPYRFDNKGWTHDRRRHLWLIDPEGEQEARCLTPGGFDEDLPAWSPDGKRVAFISDRDPKRGLVSGNDSWEVDVETGETTRVAPRGFWTAVSYRPDGLLHLLGSVSAKYPVDSYLYRKESDGSLTDMTGHLDRGSASLAAGPAAIRWEEDDAVIGLEDSGRFEVVRVSPDGNVNHLVGGTRVVTGFDTRKGGLVFTASSWDSPGELFAVEGDKETRVTNLNHVDLGLVEPEHFRITSAGTELDVWVFLPDGEEQVPLLLNIHGGPASQYGFGFFDEFQIYVGAGYGVVAANPRGSAGRGRDFTHAVVGEGWGQVDLEDMRSVVAAALDRYPRLDPERMGAMGGSYGGFLTAWIIGHEDRWRSAVVERALLSFTSFAGTSDIGGVFPENYTKESYPDAWETWWRLSPLAIAHQVTTPTLILHAEDDFRCPIEQAEQYFMALLRNETPTELLRFPGEGHEMSRSGKPGHRKERFEAILDWHRRYLS
jgi:dipeptidyl aminopeptidase/acylaminoacyl peptidase